MTQLEVQQRFPHRCPGAQLHGWFAAHCAICRWVLTHAEAAS